MKQTGNMLTALRQGPGASTFHSTSGRRTPEAPRRPGSTLRVVLLAAAMAGLARDSAQAQIASVAAGTKVDRALTIQLTPDGFQPPSISMTEGTVALLLENRSGIHTLSIQLIQDGQHAASLTSQHAPGAQDWWLWIAPKPGSYHLVVVGHTAWSCALTIVAK